jgi:hypothetical protein
MFVEGPGFSPGIPFFNLHLASVVVGRAIAPPFQNDISVL